MSEIYACVIRVAAHNHQYKHCLNRKLRCDTLQKNNQSIV